MKRNSILVLLALAVLVFAQISCSAGLPEKEKETWFSLGYFDGRSWGSAAEIGNWQVYWVSPDRVQDFQRDFYIPKGYLAVDYFATAHFPDDTPHNDKQERQACEAYNWGFFYGFYEGAGLPSP